MALLVSLGESLLTFRKARVERLVVYIGGFSLCYGVK